MSEERLRILLSEALDLCARGRKLDQMWEQAARQKGMKCASVPLWAEEQYDRDVADWEARAKKEMSP